MVAVAEMMMEADGHAVLKSGFPNCVLKRGNYLIPGSGTLLEGRGLLAACAVIQSVIADLIDMRNAVDIYHVKYPPLR